MVKYTKVKGVIVRNPRLLKSLSYSGDNDVIEMLPLTMGDEYVPARVPIMDYNKQKNIEIYYIFRRFSETGRWLMRHHKIGEFEDTPEGRAGALERILEFDDAWESIFPMPMILNQIEEMIREKRLPEDSRELVSSADHELVKKHNVDPDHSPPLWKMYVPDKYYSESEDNQRRVGGDL